MKGLRELFYFHLIAAVEIFTGKIDFRVKEVVDDEIDSLKEHGVRNVNMNGKHVLFSDMDLLP
jgi:hypothetical protein